VRRFPPQALNPLPSYRLYLVAFKQT